MSDPITGAGGGAQIQQTQNNNPSTVQGDRKPSVMEAMGNYGSDTDVQVQRTSGNQHAMFGTFDHDHHADDHSSVDRPRLFVGAHATRALHNRFASKDTTNFSLMYDRISNELLKSAGQRRAMEAEGKAQMRDDQLQHSKDTADLQRKDGDTTFAINVTADVVKMTAQAAISYGALNAPTDPVAQAQSTARMQAQSAAADGATDMIKSLGGLLHSKVEAEETEIQGQQKMESSVEQQMQSGVQNRNSEISDILSKQASISESIEQTNRSIMKA